MKSDWETWGVFRWSNIHCRMTRRSFHSYDHTNTADRGQRRQATSGFKDKECTKDPWLQRTKMWHIPFFTLALQSYCFRHPVYQFFISLFQLCWNRQKQKNLVKHSNIQTRRKWKLVPQLVCISSTVSIKKSKYSKDNNFQMTFLA